MNPPRSAFGDVVRVRNNGRLGIVLTSMMSASILVAHVYHDDNDQYRRYAESDLESVEK